VAIHLSVMAHLVPELCESCSCWALGPEVVNRVMHVADQENVYRIRTYWHGRLLRLHTHWQRHFIDFDKYFLLLTLLTDVRTNWLTYYASAASSRRCEALCY